MNDEIRELAKPSVAKWLTRALWNWIEICAIFLFINHFHYWPVVIIGIFLLGTRQHALALLAHDALHRCVSKNKYINDILGNTLTSLPIFQSIGFFKTFHLNHHAYMLTNKDPEVHVRNVSPETWGVPLSHSRRLKIFIRDLSGLGYLDTRHALPHITPFLKPIDFVAPLLFWILVVSVSLKFQMGWIPLYWTIAFVTSYWAMFRQRALTEHIGTESTHKIRANSLQRFLYLPHNTWYHYEHHINPHIPCWNLPKMRMLSKENDFISVKQMFEKISHAKV